MFEAGVPLGLIAESCDAAKAKNAFGDGKPFERQHSYVLNDDSDHGKS
jgi:hypothetical protein